MCQIGSHEDFFLFYFMYFFYCLNASIEVQRRYKPASSAAACLPQRAQDERRVYSDRAIVAF